MDEEKKYCYTCQRNRKTSAENFTNLFNRDVDDISFIDKLKSIFPLKLCEISQMLVCEICMQNLRISFDYLLTIISSQIELRRKLNIDLTSLSGLHSKLVAKKKKLSEFKGNMPLSFFQNSEDSEKGDNYLLANLQLKSCNKCKTTFYNTEELQHHICTMINKNSFETDASKEEYKSRDEKDIHGETCSIPLKIDDKIDSPSSSSCDENSSLADKFTVKENKLKKKRGRASHEHISVKCPHCEQMFEKRWLLKKHVNRVHKQDKKYVCTFCNRGFKQSYHLREHITAHTGEKNYQCNVCGKAFQRISSQKRHIRSHDAVPGQKTKRTPFLCSICGKSFPFSNGVTRHMRTHFGIKTHECVVCSRKFTQSTHLHVHMRIHTGEKPYICDECGSAFALNASLQRHKLIHRSKTVVQ